jgi:hypothetical protein
MELKSKFLVLLKNDASYKRSVFNVKMLTRFEYTYVILM